MSFSLVSNEKLCVDIRGKVMRFMQAHNNRQMKTIEIKKYGTIVFPDQCLDGTILCENQDTVTAIRNLVKREKITAKNVYINISDPSIVLRIVKVPQMSERDLKDYFDMEISQYLHVNFKTSTYDFKILNHLEEDEKKLMNVMLISVSQELICNYVNMFKMAGLNPKVVDVYPNTIARLFETQAQEDIAILDVNDSNVDFIILEKGKLFMHSSVTLEESLSDFESPLSSTDLHIGVCDSSSGVIDEISNYAMTYLNFFSSRHFGKSVDTIYVLGQLALVENIEDYFNIMFQIKVIAGLPQLFNIVPGREIHKLKLKQEICKKMSLYSSNLGLALRRV